MKPLNFQSFLLPLNGVITGIVFFLLFPTTHIYASWFPEKKNQLWLFSLGIALGSAFLWLLGSLSTPFLIKSGIFEDRRRQPRSEETAARVRYFKMALPIASFLFHMFLLIGLCVTMIVWTRGHSAHETLEGVSWNYVFR